MLYTKILLLLICIFMIPHAVFAQDASQPTPRLVEYLVTGETANLRSGAGTNFSIVGKVVKGDSLLIYDEAAVGWLRVYQEDSADAYIADYLVERAPMRFYPADQEPLVEMTGRGKQITDVFELPQGAYRIDAEVEDNSFILKTIVIEGTCRDDSIFNELNFDVKRLSISALIVSKGCSLIFETDNVDGNWKLAVRDVIVSEEFLLKNILQIENGTTISGVGRSLTMATFLPGGIWTISGNVQDRSFILHSNVLRGDCNDTSVFNEFDMNTSNLEISTVYRSPDKGCIIYWETSNVDKDWEIKFAQLR